MREPSDQDQRNIIRNALDQNLLVEAAAGTGKTTELVRRMVNVLACGYAQTNEIVAVTFTDKAAGELKLRLRVELEKEFAEAEDATRRRNLETALAHLEEAHVSTIHTFCADLLRERPVEAGVDPEFEPLAESEAERLHREAFHSWLEETLENPPEGIRRAFARQPPEGAAERLARAAWTLAEWRDFDAPWRRDPSFERGEEMDRLARQLHEFCDLTAHPQNPRDPLYLDTRAARQLAEEIRFREAVGDRDDDAREAEWVRLAFDRSARDFRQPRRGRGGAYAAGLARDAVLSAHGALVAAVERFAHRADADLAARLQQELTAAAERYQQAKVRAGRLDFLDLLLRARDLIRGRAAVRAEWQRRFRCILVDEFQDTDPLQVELLLLLASADPAVGDWRAVTPAPGKLFLVGDPKQGIYRFRRADSALYQEVKELLRARGVACLRLSTSFRATPSLQIAINAAFAPVMTGDARAHQPEYVALAPHRAELGGQPTLIALPVPRPYGQQQLAASAIEKSLPEAVGEFIRWLLDESRWTVTERERPSERLPLRPRHVAVLFRRFESWGEDVTRRYVAALSDRSIPHVLIGGKSFHQREEVESVRAVLEAVEWPGDELAVFAALRGALFALPDDALLDYRRRYQHLDPSRIPEQALPEQHQSIAEALEILRALHRRRNHRPAAETVTDLIEATRAWVGLALRPSGAQALNNVLYVAELARQYDSAGGASFRGFVELLKEEAERGAAAEAPILGEGADGVRLMTVHKAKGLEFPVVILADITARLARPRASRYLDCDRRLCAVQIGGWSPIELLEHNEEEVARDRAEGVRVAYVAATRARDLLVVPAVGDDPLELGWSAVNDWWVSPFHRLLYPPGRQRRHPTKAVGCPDFGEDTVLDRPATYGSVPSVVPGLHRFHPLRGGEPPADSSGADEARIHGVVWWDPALLDLGKLSNAGLRRHDLLVPTDPEAVDGGRRAYEAWVASRNETVGAGAGPSLCVQTMGQYAGTPESAVWPSPDDVTLVKVARDLDRPAGRRFGSLVHAILAVVPLDGRQGDIRNAAELQGRILGATREEVRAATTAVTAAFRHAVLRQARAAARRGRCRRETPVTLLEWDGTLLEGVVDLAFERKGVWVVVDFKTGDEMANQPDRYRRQVSLYARAIALTTGQGVSAILMQI